MEFNTLLMWIVGANCGMLLLRSVAARRWTGWATVALAIMLSMAAAWLIVPQRVGWVTAIPWTLFVLLPMLGNGLLGWLVARHRYRTAYLASQLFAWLHPFDGGWNLPRFVQALEYTFHGDLEQSRRLLSPIAHDRSALSNLARVLEYRLEGRWDELLSWIQHEAREQPLRDPLLIDGYLQALGETGRRHELLHEYQRIVLQEQRVDDAFQTNLIRMRVVAFCGEVAITEKLLAGPLSRLAADTRQFWLSTALQAAGQADQARVQFEQLASGPDRQLARRAQLRLEQPLTVVAAERTPEELAVLNELARTIGHETHYAVMSSTTRRQTPMTWLLILTLLAVFCLEIPGGATDELNLFELGALIVPTSLTPGEYDRYVLAAFLHFGWLHLLMNMFGLLWFGGRLERAWGGLPMLCCYLLTAIGSIVLFPMELSVLRSWGWAGNDISILVGASGGVLGLIGGLTGHLLVGLLSGRSALVWREFGILALIVTLQTVFDLNTPAVSALVHTNGLILGIVIGLVVGLSTRHRSRLSPARDVPTSPDVP